MFFQGRKEVKEKRLCLRLAENKLKDRRRLSTNEYDLVDEIFVGKGIVRRRIIIQMELVILVR